jgi:DNA-binding transcriptional regulator YhcF (GntR family)
MPPTHSATAITDTLRERILAALHHGTLCSGDRLPSLRHLGRALRADPRAVLAAYHELEAEGLVTIQPRSGVFARAPRPAVQALPEVGDWVVDIFMRGLAHGLAPTELRERARACLDTVRVRAACVECNDDQVYSLCEQLQGDYGYEPVGVDVQAVRRREALPPAVQAADVVITTGFHAAEAQRLGRRLRRPVIVATLDTAFATGVRQMLDKGAVWWVCTDERFAAKLPRMWPGADIRPIVLGIGPPDEIPAGAPIYATRRAADRLPARWRAGQVVTFRRVLSAETARALLVFLVRHNLATISRRSPVSTAVQPVLAAGRARSR